MRFNPLKTTPYATIPRPTRLLKGIIPSPTPMSTTPVLTENLLKDRLELRFPGQPSAELLQLLLSTQSLPPDEQWHFHFRGKHWYARRGEATRKVVESILALASKLLSEAGKTGVRSNPSDLGKSGEIDSTLLVLQKDTEVNAAFNRRFRLVGRYQTVPSQV